MTIRSAIIKSSIAGCFYFQPQISLQSSDRTIRPIEQKEPLMKKLIALTVIAVLTLAVSCGVDGADDSAPTTTTVVPSTTVEEVVTTTVPETTTTTTIPETTTTTMATEPVTLLDSYAAADGSNWYIKLEFSSGWGYCDVWPTKDGRRTGAVDAQFDIQSGVPVTYEYSNSSYSPLVEFDGYEYECHYPE